jgi:hypothetical protein
LAVAKLSLLSFLDSARNDSFFFFPSSRDVPTSAMMPRGIYISITTVTRRHVQVLKPLRNAASDV